MAYFRTSYAVLQAVAQRGSYADLAAFLVLARHANGRPPADLEPHRYSGAGVNAVHEKAGLSEESARGAVLRLQEHGFIRPTTAATKKLSYLARWEILHDKLDLDLPNQLADDAGGMESALRRIKTRVDPGKVRAQRRALTHVSDADLRLDLLMTLLAIYRHTSMDSFGGLSPSCCFRRWKVESKTSRLGGIRWGAEPATDCVYNKFVVDCIARGVPQKTLTDEQSSRFWASWETLKDLGLIYEAVTMFDVNPEENRAARRVYTIRVNDHHAGSIDKAGDPSLLRLLQSAFNATYSYYTLKENERDEPEAMWVILPSATGCLVGIYRPRFRSETKDVGSWHESDSEAAEKVFRSIISAAP